MEGRGGPDRLESSTSPTNGLAAPPRASTEPPCPQLGSGVPFGRQSPPTILAQPRPRHARRAKARQQQPKDEVSLLPKMSQSILCAYLDVLAGS